MKKDILLVVLALFCVTSMAFAQQTVDEKKLGVSLDLTYMSRYVTKGTEPYGNRGAWFETANFDLWGTGFGALVGHQSPSASGFVDKQRFNYGINYTNSLFNDEIYKTVYKIDWIYKHYYGRARNIGNSQNWILDFSWPNLLPIKNLSPYYIADYEYPAGSGYDNHRISGWVHRLGLSYKLPVKDWSYPLNFTSEIAYTDGFGSTSTNDVDHDWSYSTFGISTKFNLSEKLAFVPGVYHQISMDDSVNTDDITYARLSMKYTF